MYNGSLLMSHFPFAICCCFSPILLPRSEEIGAAFVHREVAVILVQLLLLQDESFQKFPVVVLCLLGPEEISSLPLVVFGPGVGTGGGGGALAGAEQVAGAALQAQVTQGFTGPENKRYYLDMIYV